LKTSTADQAACSIGSGPIAIIIERLGGRGGGAEKMAVTLANDLARKGRPVHLVSYHRDLRPPVYECKFGVTPLNLKRPSHVRPLLRQSVDFTRRVAHYLKVYPRPLQKLLWWSRHGGFEQALSTYFEDHNPRVVIAFLPPAIVAVHRARKARELPLIASLHNIPELDLQSSRRWDGNPVDIPHRSAALASFDAITVLLPSFRDWFAPELRERIHVVPNPVPEVSEERRGSKRQKTLLFVGRLAEVKRPELLVLVWSRLVGEFPDWTVKVFGAGLLRGRLTAQIRKRGLEKCFLLMGETSEISDEYLRASVLVHPAEYEGWGLAVSEALAHGLPPIAFRDCEGVNQLIRHGENGILVDPKADRVEAFVTALRRLLIDEDLRKRLGAAGPESMENYRPEKIRTCWEEVLRLANLQRTQRLKSQA
jgi:glycosyltransferase involved in cell wall biosynthesis